MSAPDILSELGMGDDDGAPASSSPSILDELQDDQPGHEESDEGGVKAELGEELHTAFTKKDYGGIYEAISKIANHAG